MTDIAPTIAALEILGDVKVVEEMRGNAAINFYEVTDAQAAEVVKTFPGFAWYAEGMGGSSWLKGVGEGLTIILFVQRDAPVTPTPSPSESLLTEIQEA